MLNESVDLVRFSVNVVTQSRPSTPVKWQGIYFLYCQLEEMLKASNCLVSHYFPKSIDEPFLANTQSFTSPLEKWSAITNKDFHKVTKTVCNYVEEVRNVFTNLWMDVSDEELKLRASCHLSWNWYWFGYFRSNYVAGEIIDGGITLKRKWVSLIDGTTAEIQWLNQFSDFFHSTGNIANLNEFQKWLKNEATHEKTLDISNLQQRIQLAHIGNKNVRILEREKERLVHFIRNNSTLEDLLP